MLWMQWFAIVRISCYANLCSNSAAVIIIIIFVLDMWQRKIYPLDRGICIAISGDCSVNPSVNQSAHRCRLACIIINNKRLSAIAPDAEILGLNAQFCHGTQGFFYPFILLSFFFCFCDLFDYSPDAALALRIICLRICEFGAQIFAQFTRVAVSLRFLTWNSVAG